MSPAIAVAVGVTFVWLGMVLAISFLEAPLKFRAPGVTVAIGLAIGRLVFRALNTVEAALGAVLVIGLIIDRPSPVALAILVLPVIVLVVQLAAVRPLLTRRSDAVLAGRDHESRSHPHHAYVLLELIKVSALGSGGVLLLSA